MYEVDAADKVLLACHAVGMLSQEYDRSQEVAAWGSGCLIGVCSQQEAGGKN
jgi:hypothetical protein